MSARQAITQYRKPGSRRYLVLLATIAVTAVLTGCSALWPAVATTSDVSDASAPVATAVTPQSFHFPTCEKTMACASAGTFPDFGQIGAMRAMCPKSPMRVAYLDGSGSNQYRKIARAEFLAEASACPNVSAVYDNADDDESTYLSYLDALMSQGVKVIVTYDDFGAAVLPELRRAYQQGIQVVAWATPVSPDAVAGKDYTGLVIENNYESGQYAARYLNRQLHGKGQLVYLAGTPGNLLDAQWLAGFHSLADPGLKIVATAQGGWTVDGNEQAMLPLMSKYPNISAIITGYTGSAAGAIQDYINAHKAVPVLVGQTDDMQNVCQYWQVHAQQPSFQIASLDGDQMYVGIALREGVAAAEGKKDTVDPPFSHGEVLINNQPFIDTSAGSTPKCDASAPPGLDFASDLPLSQVQSISQS